MLLNDPPIRDRLIWRGLLSPGTRDLGDPAVVASAFGTLYGAGATIGLLAAILNNPVVDDRGLLVVASLGGMLISAVFLTGYRRIPRPFFWVAALAGTALITLAAISSADGSEPVFGPAYTFMVMLCLLFFRPAPALAQAVVAIAAYGGLLYVGDVPFAIAILLSSTAMIAALGGLIAVTRTRVQRVAEGLEEDAGTDQLTGIPNRRVFDERLRLELERGLRSGQPLGLLLCDLDHFKDVNDRLGHDGGDRVLRDAARTINDATREIDLAARVGGEEFSVILPGADAEESGLVAERIRVALKKRFAADPVALTISCGAASAIADETTAERLYAEADTALFAAKRGGRDRSAIFERSLDSAAIVGDRPSPMERLRRLL